MAFTKQKHLDWDAAVVRRFVLAATAVFAASCAMADARDSLVHWWKAKDLNNDGLLQPTELYDIMTVSSNMPLKASEIIQDSTSEMAEPASIGTGVLHPSMRRTYDSDTYFSLNNPTNYDSEGKLIANWQSITLPKKASLPISSTAFEGTIIARIKWHGLRAKKYQKIGSNFVSNYQYGVTLYANNYYFEGARGWRAGLRMYDSGTSTQMYPTLYVGTGKGEAEIHSYAANSSTLRVRAGVWQELAISFKQDAEAGKVKALFVLRSNNGNDGRTHGRHEATETVTPAAVNPNWYFSYIGYNGMTTFKDPVGNATSGTGRGENTFGGDISDIRIYSRALSEYEILSEFVDSAPLCEVGSANSSGDEFSDSEAAAVYEPATMPWSQMRKTLNSANPSLSVKCDVEENGHGLGRLVELKVLKGDAAGNIEVAANGVVFGRKTIKEDGWLRFFVPARIMTALVRDAETGKYPLTLTFTRRGNLSGNLVVDFLRVGGAWQLGAANDSNSEFGGNGENYYNFHYVLGQDNIKQLVGSLGHSSLYAYMNLYFPVGSWAASNLAHRLTLKTAGSNASPLAIKMNGNAEDYASFGIGELYNGGAGRTLDFPAGALLDANRLYFYRTNPASDQIWNGIDYWRFETVWTGSNYDTGTAIVFQ